MNVNEAYLTDASGFTGHADAAFAPRDESGVIEVLRRAVETRTPVTTAGAGSGLTGARVARGGWVLSLEHFRQLEIRSGAARTGAAITLLELRDAAARSRQFYPPDPTEMTASVGGTIATNASGSRSFRYGSTRRYVSALRVATMDGRVREFRRGDRVDFDIPAIPLPRTTKYTAGYRLEPDMEWIDLFCGSEGTLGVILEAELKLLPSPREIFAGVVFFTSDEAALDAVDAWRAAPDLRMLEYADRNALELLRRRYPEIPQKAAAALMIEIEGGDIEAWYSRLEASSALGDDSWFALEAKDRERFRVFRHALPELVNAIVRERGYMKMGTDYAVPLERNREMLACYRRRLEQELPGQYVIWGHIGDAHVHVNMLPETASQAAKANALLTEFAQSVVELGGTVSAEHGLGKRKAHLLAIQYAPEHIEAMMNVKRRLDPLWLLGRETLFEVPPEFRG